MENIKLHIALFFGINYTFHVPEKKKKILNWKLLKKNFHSPSLDQRYPHIYNINDHKNF